MNFKTTHIQLHLDIFIACMYNMFNIGSMEPHKWIIHMEGGGYCGNEVECVERSRTDLGSSKHWKELITLEGFLSDNCTENPHFCGWSMVFIPYCDGASFSGNVYVAN